MTRRLTLALLCSLALSSPLKADPDLGAFLAARQAGITNDFAAAAEYFTIALSSDPTDFSLQQNTLNAFLALGQFERALPIAQEIRKTEQAVQTADLVLISESIAQEDWDAVFASIEEGYEIGPLMDGLTQAWAFVGKGNMDRAIESFDEVADVPGMRSYGLLHKAFALSIVGDLEGADAILSEPANTGVIPTRGSVLTHIDVLCRLGEFDRAKEMITRSFGEGGGPQLDEIRAAVEANEMPDSQVVASAREGIAYLYISLSEALRGEANDAFLLFYARAAAHMDPENASAHLASARLLESLEQYDLAAEAFAMVGTDDPLFYTAELGRADTLRAAGRVDAGIEVLNQLVRSQPDLPIVYATLGDAHRRNHDFEAARQAYDLALDRYSESNPARWWVLYTRGIANERLGDWAAAEADFRASLALNPGEPSVLNYLGYSMVEEGVNLEEALAMIQQAATARPDSGAIVDSFGWVLFKMGRYQDAVDLMERAVELEPVDAIITDHLGDVYWMVGREQEAQFQWHRALSFEPTDEEADRIRRKLEFGLTTVLEEEGVDLSEMAYDRQ